MIDKKQIIKEIFGEHTKKLKSKFAKKIKYSPFIDVPCGTRRCGECGKIYTSEEFRKGELGSGYYCYCKECKQYKKVYK